MIEKEKGEAKSFRKICHMARAENKRGRDIHIRQLCPKGAINNCGQYN